MTRRRDRFITVDGYELRYSEWGDEHTEPVVCLHGFSRTNRDFDVIAPTLAETYRVICPDLLGRGWSNWADNPTQDYTMDGYAHRMKAFVTGLGIDSFRCIGISAGGSLAIRLAGKEFIESITHVVINDMAAGPIDTESESDYDRIQAYLENPPAYDTITELESYFRDTYSQYSPMTNDEWRHFTITSARRTDDGAVTPAYDPRIVAPYFSALTANTDLWAEWEQITASIFLLTGEHSEILSAAHLENMTRLQPDSVVHTVPNCGHKPSMNVDDQIQPIVEFLAA